ncbi:S-layer homology domain-containing protein [Paenibacillus agricola]|uniref:S-layer homology domain-containing protein n=1 Tax=Paenibacillus agricola TaxID=2716264 RepID=UPI0028932867|nr:S-layer homology domain-containing protein [Paenibacillus agricola]
MKSRKKLLSLSAAVVLSLTLAGQSLAATAAFTDLDQVAAKDKIISLQSQGLVSGVSNGLFQPNATLSAAQGIQLIVKALGMNLDAIRFVKAPQATDYFAKAKNDAWYSQSFIIAANNGLKLSADLDPDQKWTKATFTKELLLALDGHNILHMIKIPVIEIKDKAEIALDDLGSVQAAIYKEIATLDADGNFHPKAEITRAEAAEMIFNTLKYVHPTPHQPSSPSSNDTPRDGSSQPMIPVGGQTDQVGQTVYENTQYGFRFTLPDSWKRYTIVTDKWEGLSIGDAQGDKVIESGAKLSIRHPEWTAEQPRQDIPILVFTVDQWNELQQDKFHIGAAPMGPSELTRNGKYVFALPARYNFAYPDGYQEVEDILKSNPIQPMIPVGGQTGQVGQTVYENTQYGFRFTLPDSWKRYTIVTDKWEGLSIGDAQGDKVIESGAKLSIRHPEWTAEQPRQDIPILVFTVDQWNELQQDKFHIGAAPIGPSELTRNDKYVFALPARYNFAYPDGYQEVEDILKSNPIQPMK